MTTATNVLKEFISDLEAVGLATVRREWPDLIPTYHKAVAAVCMVEQSEKDKALLRKLQEVMGYVQDGSSQFITLGQDDATRDWILRVGTVPRCTTYFGASLSDVIEQAHKGRTGEE